MGSIKIKGATSGSMVLTVPDTGSDNVPVDVAGLVTADATGNIGIGTNTPAAHLHIKSTGDAGIIIEADTDNTNEGDNPLLYLKQDGGLFESKIGITGVTDAIFTGALGNYAYTWANGGYQIGVGSGVNATFINNGNVGIGTKVPLYKLHVDGTAKAEKVRVGSRFTTEPSAVQVACANNSNEMNAVKTYIRHGATGASGGTLDIMRVKRHWWGQGNFEINVRGTYYSGSEDFHVQLTGHSSIKHGGTMGHQKMWGDTDRISLSSRQSSSPATPGVVGWQDVYLSMPAYNQYSVTIKVIQSVECETDAEMLNHHNCYRIKG